MLFGPQRGSPLTIFDRFAGTFGLPIIVVALALIFGNTSALLENGAVLVIVLIGPVSRLFRYFFTYYSIDAEKFHVDSGLFNKKKLEIPLDRITTVDFTQNLIFQWTHVYSVKVDNASNYGGNGAGKVTLALKETDALRVKELLLSKRRAGADDYQDRNEAEAQAGLSPEVQIGTGAGFQAGRGKGAGAAKDPSVSVVPAKNILIMGALQSKGNAVAQVISMTMVLAGMGEVIIGREMGIEDEVTRLFLSVPGIGIAAFALAAFFLISTLLGAAFALIKYYGFRIQDGEQSIYIEYGLFTKKNYSLLKEKISGVELIQSLPMRFFKVGYLNVLAVGYGDVDSPEKAMLYPLIGRQQAIPFVARYIPWVKEPEGYQKPPKSSLRYFFICPRIFFSLIIIGGAIAAEILWEVTSLSPVDLNWVWVLLGMIPVLAVLSVLVEYRNTGLQAGMDNIQFITGGFTRTMTVVRTRMVESVTDKGTRWKRRRGVATINMGILAPAIDSIKRVRNMGSEAFEQIRDVIHY